MACDGSWPCSNPSLTPPAREGGDQLGDLSGLVMGKTAVGDGNRAIRLAIDMLQDNAIGIDDLVAAGHRFDRPGLGRPSGSLLEAQSAIHVFHELAKILVSGRALRADLRNVLEKLLAYSSFDRRFWAPQLSKKSPVNGEVCWIAYNPHCLRHRRRGNFATLLLRTFGL